MTLMAVDPGLRHCGVAVFVGGELSLATLAWGAEKGRGPAAWAHMVDACDQLAPSYLEELVVEQQQVYGPGQRKGDPDDLFQICGVAGGLVGRMRVPSAGYYPREWKGQVDADVFTERIRARLMPTEVARIEKCPKSLEHNVLDAVGLGLFHLGRLTKKRVYAR